ncbi:HAD family hydrolase [Pseudomonas sp. 25 E 4]|uniref:HAD family hydrolase n=1 Tax=Pseudomonas sp. 25 E 4 TaxID=1844097 RepID=UPI0008120898|nr:HAD family hydrolase [Pseudomonas sp. 25 E 4]CRM69909.1 HAD hydrolase, REG-2-like, family IA [Pseudomonas sp. 25 E 4]
MISAVVFDAFGTIVRIGQRTNPYSALLREGRRQGVALASDSTHFVMTANLSFDQVADHLQIELSSSKRAEMKDALGKELASIERYPDALEAIDLLQEVGVVIGICSNLAQPYGPVIRKAFPHVQCHAFSYELGVMKPAPRIYLSICREMGVEASHAELERVPEKDRVVMIGDSRKCDRNGPRAVGIKGYHLDRSGMGQISDLMQFANLVIESKRALCGSSIQSTLPPS